MQSNALEEIFAHLFSRVIETQIRALDNFRMAAGNSATPYGINAEGLKRRGFSADALNVLKRAYRTLYKSGLMLDEAKARLEEDAKTYPAEIQPILDFLAVSKRGIIR